MKKDNNKLATWYYKYMYKIIPDYAFFSIILCFVVNGLMYSGSQYLMKDAYHYDFTSVIDKKIPFVKEWILLYVSCYIFWIVNYILISREGEESWYRFLSADLISKFICGLFFVLLPTTNIRPILIDHSFINNLVLFVYSIDPPTNLFPSVHCLVSWFCFIGIKKSNKIPYWYKVFSAIFAILVFASTQFTKQHILIDIVGGVIIAEICFKFTTYSHIYIILKRIFDRVNRKVLNRLDG